MKLALHETNKGATILSEFYHLRRTAIKDIAAYLGFLMGFIGAAPFAWGLLAGELESGRFSRGLWYFFAIVTGAGVFAGIAGLGIGYAAGSAWEQFHRYRRNRKAERGERPHAPVIGTQSTDLPSPPPSDVMLEPEAPRLRLVSADSTPISQLELRLRTLMPADIRDFVLGLVAIGNLGLIADLLLIEHTESATQWIPLALLGLGLAAILAIRVRPSPLSFRVFRLTMFAFVAGGMLGLYFHYAGNVEFALERSPELKGVALVWKSLRGATPALAPVALSQLGLLGLVYAHRHPHSTKPEREHI